MKTLLRVVLFVSAMLLVARMAFGPLQFPIAVNSPINLETIFALSALLLTAIHTDREPLQTQVARTKLGRKDVLIALALFLFTLGAFAHSANDYFLSDDFIHLRHAANANYKVLFVTAGGDGFFRPVGYLLHAATFQFAAHNPAYWHWVGFALHGLNVVLVFLLAGELGLTRFAAAFAGLVFAVHGSHPESVLWIAGRFDLYAAFFALLCIICFLRRWHIWGVIAMLLALLSKESAYAIPALLLTVSFQHGSPLVKRLIPYFASAAALFAYRWCLLGGIGGYHDSVGLLAASKAIFLRLWAVLFFPVNWTVVPETVLVIVTAIFVLTAAALVRPHIPRRQFWIFLSFTVLTAVPAIPQLLIGPDLQKARVLYLPAIGFALLVSASFASQYQISRKDMSIPALAMILVAFQLASLQHNLTAWKIASERVRLACYTVARCKILTISTPPRSVNGVYFLANGFQECVGLHGDSEKADTCSFEWTADGSLTAK